MKRLKVRVLSVAALIGLAIPAGIAWAGDIHEAARKGDLDKVKSLLKESPQLLNEQDDYGRTPLSAAVDKRQRALAEYLVNLGADVNIPNSIGNTPLHEAAKDGDLEVVRFSN